MSKKKQRFELTAGIIAGSEKEKVNIVESEDGSSGYDRETNSLRVPKEIFYDDELTDLLLSCVFSDSLARRGQYFTNRHTPFEKLYKAIIGEKTFANTPALLNPFAKLTLETLINQRSNSANTIITKTFNEILPLSDEAKCEWIAQRVVNAPSLVFIHAFANSLCLPFLETDGIPDDALKTIMQEIEKNIQLVTAFNPKKDPVDSLTVFEKNYINSIAKIYLSLFGLSDNDRARQQLQKEIDELNAKQSELEKIAKELASQLTKQQTQLIKSISQQLSPDTANNHITENLTKNIEDLEDNLKQQEIDPNCSEDTIKQTKKELSQTKQKLKRAQANQTTPEQQQEQLQEIAQQLQQNAEKHSTISATVDKLKEHEEEIIDKLRNTKTPSLSERLQDELERKQSSYFSQTEGAIAALLNKLSTIDFSTFTPPEDETLESLITRKLILKEDQKTEDHNGTLNARHLTRVITNTVDPDTPIYNTLQKRDRKTVVSVMLDVSGSMFDREYTGINDEFSTLKQRALIVKNPTKNVCCDQKPWRENVLREVVEKFIKPLLRIENITENLLVDVFVFSDGVAACDNFSLLNKNINHFGISDYLQDCTPNSKIVNFDSGTNLFKTIDAVTRNQLTKHQEDNLINIILTDANVRHSELEEISRNLENNRIKQLFIAIMPSKEERESPVLKRLTGDVSINTVEETLPILKQILAEHL